MKYADPAVMAGVGMGHTFKMLFGTTVMLGVNQGFESYLNHANGAKEYKLAGTYLNRARFIVFLTFIPCSILLLNTGNICLLLKQNPSVALNA